MFEPDKLSSAIRTGDHEAAGQLTRGALEARIDPQEILDALIAGMEDVGERFGREEAFVPELMIAARAMKAAMCQLEPRLVEAGIRPEHTVVLGTVQGDMHDIGKDLVGMMWKGANLEVVDLGVNVAAKAFVEAVRLHRARVVGLSTLLTTTMPAMADIVKTLRHECGDGVRIVVGGAPVSPDWAEQIGADAYAADAGKAVEVARGLIAF